MKILQPLFGLRFDKSVIFSFSASMRLEWLAMAANVVFDKYQLKWETLRSLHTLATSPNARKQWPLADESWRFWLF